jgi:hypothetical protein
MAFWPSYCDNFTQFPRCDSALSFTNLYFSTLVHFIPLGIVQHTISCSRYFILLEWWNETFLPILNRCSIANQTKYILLLPDKFSPEAKLAVLLFKIFYGEFPKLFWNPPLWEKSKKVRAITVSRQLVWSLKFLMLWIYQWYQSYSLYIYAGCTVRIFVHIQIFFLFE